MALRGLPGGRLAFAAADPRLGLLGADGKPAWGVGPATADFRDQSDVFAVSADGARLGFGYEQWGKSPALFSLPERRLAPGGTAAGLAAARTAAPGLAVEGWKDGTEPSLNGKRLALEPYETARSLAVAPDGRRFVLGSEWSLRLFDQAGKELWRRPVPGVAWAVNVSGDGRLVVAAYGDGTIRWHRLSDGAELLALYPHPDRQRWVLWTPQGYYDASPGAEDLIGWQVNRGRDAAPEFYTASRFRDRFHRPDVIDRVLQELDVDAAVAKAGTPRAGRRRRRRRSSTSCRRRSPSSSRRRARGARGRADRDLHRERARARPADAGEAARRRRPRGRGDTAALGERPARAAADRGAAGGRLAAHADGEEWAGLERSGHRPPAPARPGDRPRADGQPLRARGRHQQYRNHGHLALSYAVADAEDFCTALLPQQGCMYKEVQVRPLTDGDATQRRRSWRASTGWSGR